jgi:hypothetical protein
MKKSLLFTLALLAIGFGVSQVFLQGEERKRNAQMAQPQLSQTPITQPQIAQEIVQVPIEQPKIIQPQIPQPPVTQISDTQPQGDSFYYLLHPDRKNPEENPDTEEAKKAAAIEEK